MGLVFKVIGDWDEAAIVNVLGEVGVNVSDIFEEDGDAIVETDVEYEDDDWACQILENNSSHYGFDVVAYSIDWRD